MRLNLRQWRLRRVMTQEQLAEKSGIAEATISRIESGQEARISTIQKLARALDIEPAELIVPGESEKKRAA